MANNLGAELQPVGGWALPEFDVSISKLDRYKTQFSIIGKLAVLCISKLNSYLKLWQYPDSPS
jgi:hypothetical protein